MPFSENRLPSRVRDRHFPGHALSASNEPAPFTLAAARPDDGDEAPRSPARQPNSVQVLDHFNREVFCRFHDLVRRYPQARRSNLGTLDACSRNDGLRPKSGRCPYDGGNNRHTDKLAHVSLHLISRTSPGGTSDGRPLGRNGAGQRDAGHTNLRNLSAACDAAVLFTARRGAPSAATPRRRK
jgi:hypothetical protein